MTFNMKGSSFFGKGNQSKSKHSPLDMDVKGIAGKLGKMSEDPNSPAPYASPAKNVADPRHPHNKKGEHVMTTTRTATSETRSKGGKSSTYNITNTKDNKDGSKTHTFTNELGNSYKANHKRVDNKKSSPADYASPAKQNRSTTISPPANRLYEGKPSVNDNTTVPKAKKVTIIKPIVNTRTNQGENKLGGGGKKQKTTKPIPLVTTKKYLKRKMSKKLRLVEKKN